MNLHKAPPPVTDTPPSSPVDMAASIQPHSANVMEAARLFKELIAAVNSSPELAELTEPLADSAQDKELKDINILSPQNRYRTVIESWSPTEHKYKVVEQPVQASNNLQSVQFVFDVRVRVDKTTGTPTHYIDVKSAELRDTLKTILADVTGVSLKDELPAASSLSLEDELKLTRLKVERTILFHHLEEIESFTRSKIGKPFKDHMDILTEYLLVTFSQTRKTLTGLLHEGEITYDLLWALFKPDDIIYTTCPGTKVPRCIKLSFCEERKTRRGQTYLHVEGRCLTFDGKIFGETRVPILVEKFRGAKKLHFLEAFPLCWHPHQDMIKKQLILSGQKFIDLIGCHHRQCHGPAFFMHQGEPLPFHVDGRVSVDAELFRLMNPTYVGPEIDKPSREHVDKLVYWDTLDQSEPGNKVRSINLAPSKVTEKDLLICSPTVYGFSFSNKLWLEIAVSGISKIDWDESAWDNLVLPEKSKEILLALASAHLSSRRPQPVSSVTRRSGQGLNMLFYGPPGVGKTLSAESLAEHLKRPLYLVSAGELGTDPKKLDACLSDLFRLARNWDAVLLLDEADVYLEQRTTENVLRNALVSVFLRQLERFDGVLILTTNRVDDFDDAILNRVQWKMRYPNIDETSRLEIWKKNLSNTNGLTMKSEELLKLVKNPMNGREIANHISTASALAQMDGKHLSFSYLRTVVGAGEGFKREFAHTERSEGLYT